MRALLAEAGRVFDVRLRENSWDSRMPEMGALLPAANRAECLLLRLSFRPVYARVGSNPAVLVRVKV